MFIADTGVVSRSEARRVAPVSLRRIQLLKRVASDLRRTADLLEAISGSPMAAVVARVALDELGPSLDRLRDVAAEAALGDAEDDRTLVRGDAAPSSGGTSEPTEEGPRFRLDLDGVATRPVITPEHLARVREVQLVIDGRTFRARLETEPECDRRVRHGRVRFC